MAEGAGNVEVWISRRMARAETGVFQYALEPTTAAADSLEAAIVGDGTLVVMPGERRTWWVTLELGSSRDTLADYLAAGTDEFEPARGDARSRMTPIPEEITHHGRPYGADRGHRSGRPGAGARHQEAIDAGRDPRRSSTR